MTSVTDQTRRRRRPFGPLPAGHPPVRTGKVGVMLVNLGTPDGTDFRPMWRYLREFLSDPRVIELPRAIWYPILYGIVLTTRPKKVRRQLRADLEPRARRVAAAHLSRARQAEKLAAALADLPEVVVDWAHALRQSVDRERGRSG